MFKRFLMTVIIFSLFILAGCSSNVKPMEIGQIPWGNYQRLTYDIFENDKLVGTAEFTIEKSQSTNTYEISSITKIDSAELSTSTSVTSDTLMPLSSYYSVMSPQGDIKIETAYKDKWNIKAKTPKKGEQNLTVKLPKYYYDNDSLLMIMRAYPFQVGAEFTIYDAIASTAQIAPITNKVVSKEKVIVPYGEAKCFKVELKAGAAKQYIWYSDDENRLLYQYDNGKLVYKLKKVENNK
ncbi:Protein of unknown function [Thermoanaerobacter thermohydrosulfuricus]|uniref:DUF3108 domain-containing protein n=1 Tax=Thermoanaerobacter thermohydrosulfuricus TaxID=1516 RepID=A0A1I2DJI6_THETY|nr:MULTISPECIES: DUF3108 domain-containing protein [Thermoanaerobacter]SDG12816.1 Protein of unknown function [Thermoanaerobacter thermohydrosulfuricus]SFE80471.1 Protein of unknown function [Thermoanaerobacter thermohydrosulfuricus]HHY79589.1 DUF3108 domain-containing protein [Thermoanaerobacter sp.]